MSHSGSVRATTRQCMKSHETSGRKTDLAVPPDGMRRWRDNLRRPDAPLRGQGRDRTRDGHKEHENRSKDDEVHDRWCGAVVKDGR
jgi:hypothetical protein